MTVGGIFILLSFLLFVCLGAGLTIVSRAEYFAFALLALGILLLGFPLPPWRGP